MPKGPLGLVSAAGKAWRLGFPCVVEVEDGVVSPTWVPPQVLPRLLNTACGNKGQAVTHP